MPTVQCPTHGLQPQTLVCQHIAVGLIERRRVGFFWASDPGNPYPDAWCRDCNERVAAAGDWVGDALDQFKPQVLCAACYEAAKTFHVGGDPWS
jgi:hypothetical protein